MKKEISNFIITSNNNLEYFDDIVNYIIEHELKIQEFFNIKSLSNKYNIDILSRNKFDEVILQNHTEIKDYIRGNTSYKFKTISILELMDQKKTVSHKNATLEEMEKMIMHEVVHAYHNEFGFPKKETIWFREGLATNLSEQNYKIIDLQQCDFNRLVNNFSNYKNSYDFAYTIVNYILNNYEHSKILNLVKNNEILIKNSNRIFEQAKNN